LQLDPEFGLNLSVFKSVFCGRYYDLFLQNYLLLAKDKGWKQPLLGEISILFAAALEHFV